MSSESLLEVLGKEDVLNTYCDTVDEIHQLKGKLENFFAWSKVDFEIQANEDKENVLEDVGQLVDDLIMVQGKLEDLLERHGIWERPKMDLGQAAQDNLQESKEILSLAEIMGLWGTEEFEQAIGLEGLPPSMRLSLKQRKRVLALCQLELDSKPRDLFVPDLALKYLERADRW